MRQFAFLFFTGAGIAWAAFALSLAAFAGCQASGYDERLIYPDASSGSSGWTPDSGSPDAPSDPPEPPPDSGDAGPSPVLLGITPTPAVSGASELTAGDELSAALTTLAAGARSVVISRSLRELDKGGYSDVAADVSFYEKHDIEVLFNLAFVERKADGRPLELASLPWSAPEVRAALHSAIDKLLQKLGGSLDMITFGRDVDVFLDAHPDERDAILALAAQACEYTRGHPSAAPGLRVAIAASFEGVASKSASVQAILDASDVMALSYLPGQGSDFVAPASEIASNLDQMIAAAAGKPIVLQAAGYPSSPVLQSSPGLQRLFFETFFAALAPRRSSFAWVNVHELHDLWPAACAAYAAAQGEPPDGSTASFACSLGLFTSGGEEKLAWLEVLKGSATFASP